MKTLHTIVPPYPYADFPFWPSRNGYGHIIDRWIENNRTMGLFRWDSGAGDGRFYIIVVKGDEYNWKYGANNPDDFPAYIENQRNDLFNANYRELQWNVDKYYRPEDRSRGEIIALPELTVVQLAALPDMKNHECESDGDWYCTICDQEMNDPNYHENEDNEDDPPF